MPDPADIQARVAAWQRTGDLDSLWPDVTGAELRAAHAGIRSVAEAMLRSPERRATLAGADHGAPRALGVAAFMGGVGPLLGWWIEQGRVDAPAAVRDLFALHLEHGRRRAARLQLQLGGIVRALRAAEVEPVILKGLHTGAVYFPAGTRPCADIDLLVEPGERDRAAGALVRAGLVERRRTRWANRSEWTPAGPAQEIHSLELDHADDPWSVDLHVALERWYARGLRRDLGEPRTTTFGGDALRGLAQPHLTAFLALHASHDLVKVRIVRLVELALVTSADGASGRLDWGELERLLRETRTERFVWPALTLAHDLAPASVPADLLARLGRGSSARTRRVMDAVRAADFAPLRHRSLDARLMWADGPVELLLGASELIWSSDDGLPLAPLAMHGRRLRALVSGHAGWRARATPRGAPPAS